MRKLVALVLFVSLMVAMAMQVDVYRNVRTHSVAFALHLPDREVGYSAGWFNCHKGEC